MVNDSLSLATFASGETTIELTAVADQRLRGVVLRRGLVEQRELVIVRNETLECKLFFSPHGNPYVTRENPFVSAEGLAHLDADGVVKLGTVVRGGSIAVSVLRPMSTNKRNKPGCWRVNDDSCEIPAELDGYEVVAVARQNIRDRPSDFEPRMIERIEVALRRLDQVTVGDWIVVDGDPQQIVGIAADDQLPKTSSGETVDLLLPVKNLAAEIAPYKINLSRMVPTAAESIRARSVGAYSLISLQPLRSRDLGSEQVSAAQVYWLHRHGFFSLAGEFASLKSDDTLNRPLLKSLGETEAEYSLDIELAGPESLFLLTEQLRALGLEVTCKSSDGHVTLNMQPASLDLMQRTAPAEIKKPETINYRTYLPVPGGLFCESAFGPESMSRRRTAAHIPLKQSVIPAIFRLGKHSMLSQALGIDSATVEAIVSYRLGVDTAGQFVEMEDESPCVSGAEAIQWLLTNRCQTSWGWEQHMVQNFVYVLPPDLRPLVLLSNGNFATSDLNDFLRQVINRNNRLGKLVELKAPPAIIQNEKRELQCVVDQLHANGGFHPAIMGDHNRPLISTLDLVLQHLCDTETKQQDWSGSARMIVDESLPIDRCLVPANMFDTLRLSESEPVLLSTGRELVACYPQSSPGFTIEVRSMVAEKLGASPGQVCAVYRPVTKSGSREARSMIEFTPKYPFEELPQLNESQTLEDIVAHIAAGNELALNRAQWLLLGGVGGTSKASDQQLPQYIAMEPVEVPKRVAEPPTESELVELIESFVKTSMLFRAVATEVAPEPSAGRLGGNPWLPPGTPWPMFQGDPVPFLAQLPLSPAIPLSLPFPVEPNSLLTIFWDDGWSELPATSAPCLIIHSAENLQLVEPPSGVERRSMHRLEFEIKQQLPSLADDEELKIYYENIPAELMQQIRQRYEGDPREVTEDSRVGGHAFWIQSAHDAFVAQFISSEVWNATDGGCLVICGKSPEGLTAWIDYD